MTTKASDAHEGGEDGGLHHSIARLERKLDMVHRLLMSVVRVSYDNPAASVVSAGYDDGDGEGDMPHMTTRQHACLQMLVRGASNQEIADRLHVSVNTIKVHVRAVAKKIGLSRRTQIGLAYSRWLDTIDDDTYRVLSGGLLRNWDRAFSEPDPFGSLYREVSYD